MNQSARQSQIFSKTRHDAPKDEVSKNAQLLIRAGFIHKEMAGVYTYLPLGLRVLKKMENIVRDEINNMGGQEILLSTLQNKELWEKTNRWDDSVVDNWFKAKLKNDTEVGLGFSHEEPLTSLLKDHLRSYKDFPVSIYQIQTKFRNEARAKSGILRGREFLMKDLYSFSRTDEEHNLFYEKSKEAYTNIFKRAGIGDKTYITFASGGIFSKYSHEFQTETDAGEDTIYLDPKTKIAVNKEVYNDEVLETLGLEKSHLEEKKAIEVGNIFTLGTRFSDAFDLNYTNENKENHKVLMGCYGIGIGRLMGTVVEVKGEKDAMYWPEEVSPFKVHLIGIANDDEKVRSEIDEVYKRLVDEGVEVLYDDRDMRAGEKFSDADLIGIPHRLVVSKKTLEAGLVEYENRIKKEKENLPLEKIIKILK